MSLCFHRFEAQTGNEIDEEGLENIQRREMELTEEEESMYMLYKQSKGWTGLTNEGDTMVSPYK